MQTVCVWFDRLLHLNVLRGFSFVSFMRASIEAHLVGFV